MKAVATIPVITQVKHFTVYQWLSEKAHADSIKRAVDKALSTCQCVTMLIVFGSLVASIIAIMESRHAAYLYVQAISSMPWLGF